MKPKTTKALNKARKNKALVIGLGYRYAGLISARQALKAGEHKLLSCCNQRDFMAYCCPTINMDRALLDFNKISKGIQV